MEVLHPYNGSYPFGLKKESESTYMELVKENLSQQDLSLYRQMCKIYKGINSPHFIRLVKMLREESKLFFIYEYEETSIEEFLVRLKNTLEGPLPRDRYKSLILDFKTNIDQVLEVLIKSEIKTEVFLSNVACCTPVSSSQHFLLKVFVDLEAEYLSLIDHGYRPKDSKRKDRSGTNQEFLSEFYDAERKRLMLDFEQLLQKYFGKIHDPNERKNFSNFVIQGTKLVFMHPDDKDSSGQNKGDGLAHNREKLSLKGAYKQLDKDPEGSKGEQQLKAQKSQEKWEEEGRKGHPQMPIVDFDQSFEPEFRPEEFLKEKTYIYEENDYLDALEDEMIKMTGKKAPEAKPLSQEPKKEEKIDAQKSKPQTKNDQPNEKKEIEKKESKTKDLTISQGSTQSNPNNQSNNHSNSNNRSKDMSSNNDSYQKKERETKGQGKINKYKMKIITSHQIEIEGGEEPNVEEIEKEIIEGIRTGKININDLNNHQKFTVMTKTSEEDKSKNHDGNMYKSDHKEDSKDNKDVKDHTEKMTNSENLKKEENSPHAPQVKTQEIPMSKMKTVNDIIQKLGIKGTQKPKEAETQPNQTSQTTQTNQTNQTNQTTVTKHTAPQPPPLQIPNKSTPPQYTAENSGSKKNQHPSFQTATTPKQEKNEHNDRTEKHEKPERIDKPEREARGQKGETVEKVEKETLQKAEHPPGGTQPEKNEKTENYLNKIRQAKNKAEQLLREYTKKKQ